MSISRKFVDVRKSICTQLVYEEFDICACDKCFSCAFQNNRLDGIIRIQIIQYSTELCDKCLIECIHGFWTVQSYGCNRSSLLNIDIIEFPGMPGFSFDSKKWRQVKFGKIGIGGRHSVGFIHTDGIHDFKRATHPSQTNLCTTINIFH